MNTEKGRGTNLIVVGIITLITVFMIIFWGRYFISSLFISQLLAGTAAFSASEAGSYRVDLIFMIIVSIIPAVAFIALGFIASKYKKVWPNIVGLILYSLDSLIMFIYIFMTNIWADSSRDIVFHILFLLIIAYDLYIAIKLSKERTQVHIDYVVQQEKPIVSDDEEDTQTTAEPEINSEPENNTDNILETADKVE